MKLSSEEIRMLHTALDILTGAYGGGTETPFVQELLRHYQSDSPRDKAAVLRRKLDQEALILDKGTWDEG